ncbi:MAG: hypothetical protein Q8929_01150 [Bacillota bacterium]|nr:hypothetical protein [Bacillota bacterium]
MKNKILILTYLSLIAVIMLYGTDVFAVGESGDAGLNASVGNLVSILKNNLVPIVLVCGCLAGVALSFMKSSPTPFIVALITTASFGFAHAWINGTYAVLV